MASSSALILSGGVAHDYAVTSPMLATILQHGGITAEITERLHDLTEARLHDFDVLILNCVRWSAEWSDGPDGVYRFGDDARRNVIDFLESGKGLVALHAATINFDDWPAYRDILGGCWEWEHAGHGPYQPGWMMHIVDRAHPITQGIDDFEIHDELYHTLTLTRHVHTLMTTLWNGKLHPMAWTTSYGPARIHYNALGHGLETFRHPSFQQMLKQGVLWAAGYEGHTSLSR